jgi:putative copper resistance protein D
VSIDKLMSCIHIVPEWLELVFLNFSIGVLVCRLWVLEDSVVFRRNLLARMWRLLGIAAAAMIASSIGDLLVRAAEMSGQAFSRVFSVLPTVVLHTHLGHVWLIRIAALLFLLIALSAGRRRLESRAFMFFMLGLMAIISMTKSASGHASDAGDFSVSEIMDWLHLVAASIWGGGLFVLAVAILPDLARGGKLPATVSADVACRFSRMAGIAVGIIVITSLYNAWSFVGSAGALWKAPYGWTVIAKTVLFLLLVCLGAYNRYVSVPLLREWAALPPVEPGIISRGVSPMLARFSRPLDYHLIIQRFERNIRIEALLMVMVLLCATLLRHEIPARHHSHMGNEGDGRSLHPHN